MNITKEDQGNQTTLLKIEIAPSDYTESVEKQLRDYQKTAAEPGFRVGKVPLGIMKRKYGKALRLDEVNKILSDKINAYIQENELPVIGQPLPNETNQPSGDFNKDDNYIFYFDLGLAPDIDLNLNNLTIDFHKIKVEDKQVDEYVEDLRKQHGNQESVDDEVKKGDILKGTLEELDENLTEKEDGILNEEATLSIDHIMDEETQNKMLGMKAGDMIDIDPRKISGSNEAEMASLLGVEKEKLESVNSLFRFTLNDITRLKPAEMDEEFFKKVDPSGEIIDEKTLREKIIQDIEKRNNKESERLLMYQASEKLIEELDPKLPDEFMKRWMVQNDENLTREVVEKNYSDYTQGIKWQLIENRLLKDFNIEVKDEEVRNQYRNYFMGQFGGGNIGEDMKKQLEPIIDSMMKNEEQTKQIYDQLYDDKIAAVLHENCNLNVIEVSGDEFREIALEIQNKNKPKEEQVSEESESDKEA
jgi:trigger factor